MWIVYAVGASMLWGLTYVLSDELYKRISITTTLLLTSIATFVFMIILAMGQGVLRKDLFAIANSKSLSMLVLAQVVVFVLAEICIALSIQTKNATLAGLVEISYPIFIALFAYLFFKEDAINATSIAGALLIFSGIFVIYHFN